MNIITHRCEGSLRNEISIRLTKESGEWKLFELVDDPDYQVKYLSCVSKIEYCPFCGKKLNEVEEC